MTATRALPSAEQVLAVLGEDTDYVRAGRSLGVPPGLAYLIATGLPADGSEASTSKDRSRPGTTGSSTQHLANPSTDQPTSKSGTVRTWIRHRSGADPAMRAAGEARTAQPPPPEATDQDKAVTTVLGRDHGQLNALLQELAAIPGAKAGTESDRSRRQSIVDLIAKAAAAHESVEEELFWPRVREILDDGEAMAEEATAQEQRATEVLAALGQLGAGEERFDELVEELEAVMRKHVALEDRVFLALTDSVADDELEAWGERVRQAERRRPTRPHPRAPRRPAPAVRATAPMAAVVDKVQDSVGGRPADRKGQEA